MSLELTEFGSVRAPEPAVLLGQARAPRRLGRVVLVAGCAVLVAFLPPVLSFVALLGVVVVLVLLSKPLWTLYALLFAVPFESVRNLQAGGLNVTVTDLSTFCLAAAWFAFCTGRQRFEAGPVPWLKPLLFYGLVIGISITQASDLISSAKELLKWGELVLVYVIGCTLLRTRMDIRALLGILFLAILGESAVGLFQTVLHSGPASFGRGAFLRASGTFDQPNPFAGYLNMTFPIAVALLGYRAFPRLQTWLLILATGGGVLISLSRGGELASISALVVMALVAVPKSRTPIALCGVLLSCAITLAGVGILPSGITDSLSQQLGVSNIDVANPTPDNWAVAERLAHMEAGLYMFADHPLLGVGIGNYPDKYTDYRVADVWQAALGHAHNYYINIAAEAGVIGLFAFIFLFGSAIVLCVQAWRRAVDPFDKAIALGGLGVIVGIMVHSFFDDIFVHGMEVQVAIVMVVVSRVWAEYRNASQLERGE